MYLDNKYTDLYFRIVARARHRVNDTYTENHHIIPKSLGGSNSPNNLVRITAREHFICHWLLTKMVTSTAKAKMIYALWCMVNVVNKSRAKKTYKVTSRRYEHIRTLISVANSGEYHSRAKTYEAVSPTGEKTLIRNLKKFCIDQDLSYDCVLKLVHKHIVSINGKTKGWSFVDINSALYKIPFREKLPGGNRKTYLLSSPSNEKFVVVGQLAKFCKEHNLELSTIQQIEKRGITAKKGTCKGWLVEQQTNT